MNSKILILLVFFLIDIILPIIFRIIDLDMQYYLVYVIWFNILLILYIILPSNVGSIFL